MRPSLTSWVGAAAPLPFFLALALSPPVSLPKLVVRAESGMVVLELPLALEPSWAVFWNHSVTGATIEDYYRFEEGRMLLSASHAPDFAAGLGYTPGRGRLESDDRHGYWIRDIDEPVPGNCYWLRVGGERVNHRIVHGGEVHSLSAAVAGQRVRICAEEAADHE